MFFSWEKLAGIFSFSYFRYLILWFSITPTAVSIISSLKNHGYALNINIHLPFSWEILWVSSFFYVIGYFLFYTSCPIFIKKYKNIQNYERLMLPKDYIMEEWVNFIKEFESLPQFVQNNVVIPLFERKMALFPETMRLIGEPYLNIFYEDKSIDEEIKDVNYKSAKILIKLNHLSYIFSLAEVSMYRDFNEETAFKKYYLYLSEVYEKFNGKTRKIISLILLFSFSLFIIVVLQNIYHALIYMYHDFLEHFF